MTITYPRALPSAFVTRADLILERKQTVSNEAGGKLISAELAPAYWRLRLETTPRSRAEFDAWVAWQNSLRGAARFFLGRDVRRGRYPLAYARTGFADLERAAPTGGAFDGTSDDCDFTDNQAPTIGKLPAGFVVSIGDYVGFTFTGGRTLHRFTEAGAADIDGNVALALEPEIPALVPSDAVANFLAPNALMKILPGTFDAQENNKQRVVSFEAASQPLE